MAAVIGLMCVDTSRSHAQVFGQWTLRKQIHGIHELADTPYLVADQNQTVHAFYSQPLGDDPQKRAIVYNQWNQVQGWSKPNDIMLPVAGYLAEIKGVFLDQKGIIHIIFYSGNENSADIYYTWASAINAGRAPAWSDPQIVGKNAILQNAALAGDDQGNLYVIYSGNYTGNGIYAVHSMNGGASWSQPALVFLTTELLPFLSNPQVQLDREHQLHAIWLLNDKTGTGKALYYAKLAADETLWREPVILAEVGQPDERLEGGIISSRITWPTLAYNGEHLIVMYTVCEPCEKRVQRSLDGGDSWLGATVPFESRGDYGGQGFTVDSNGAVHVIFGDRQRGGNLWYSVWQAGQWLEPKPMMPASEVENYKVGNPLVFQPWEPRSVVSQGNILLATWVTDPGAGDNGVWYSYMMLDTPELQRIPLPTLPLTPTPTATGVTTQSTPTATPTLMAGKSGITLSRSSQNPAGPLLISVMPVLLLLAVVIAVRKLPRWRRY
ncbi:MAG: hypothetical protein R3C14_40645 [Caldilineaceae bacterium]